MKARPVLPRGTHLKNKELVAIRKYLNGELAQMDLGKKLGRSRTNNYYYVGRAVHFWIKTGVLRWKRGVTDKELGGEMPRKRKPKPKKEEPDA